MIKNAYTCESKAQFVGMWFQATLNKRTTYKEPKTKTATAKMYKLLKTKSEHLTHTHTLTYISSFWTKVGQTAVKIKLKMLAKGGNNWTIEN